MQDSANTKTSPNGDIDNSTVQPSGDPTKQESTLTMSMRGPPTLDPEGGYSNP